MARTAPVETNTLLDYAPKFAFFLGFAYILRFSDRVIPVVILLLIFCADLQNWFSKVKYPTRKLWIAFWLILFFYRIDITFQDLPGPPHIVPYYVGYPTQEAMNEIIQGDPIWHGCMTTLLEPFWVVVW